MIDRRAFFKKGLHPVYMPHYELLCTMLKPIWQPYSGFRSIVDQDRLYAKGRTEEPIGPQFEVTRARGGQSAHNYGCATDWTIFDGPNPIWLKKDDPRWQEYIGAVKFSNLRSGESWSDVDHNEMMLTCPWNDVFLCYNSGGVDLSTKKIFESRFQK